MRYNNPSKQRGTRMSASTPITKETWNVSKARHLLNRAGFGVPESLVDKLASMSPEEAVDYLVNYEQFPYEFPAPDFLIEPFSRNKYKRENENLSEEEIRKINQDYQREEREAVVKLKVWWMRRMAQTPRPLEEKMALFWHGHFAASAQKVKYSEYMHEYGTILRANATGNFKKLTTAVGQSRAMLNYLDNRKSTKEHPNENWARELMELFTLGVGKYSEKDIKESARAFTGWWDNGDTFKYKMEDHDFGKKEFLGESGNFDGWDILDIIFKQPVCAEFICHKLCLFFNSENPNPELVQSLAATFRDGGYELKPVLRQLFLSEAFYAPDAVGTQVKSPAQLAVQLAHHLDMENPPWFGMAQSLRGLGQDLYYPPNVKGWDGNRAWINANTLLLRYNLPMTLLNNTQREEENGMAMMAAPGAANDSEVKMKKMSIDPADGDKAVMERLREELREALSAYPPDKRRDLREKLKTATGKERRELLAQLGIRPTLGAAALAPFFGQLQFTSAGECVNQATSRLLAAAISDEQRATLLRAIGHTDMNAPLTPERLDANARRALVHLITSMAEYQLC